MKWFKPLGYLVPFMLFLAYSLHGNDKYRTCLDYYASNHNYRIGGVPSKFYLNGKSGNDKNDGRSIQAAVKTVARLLSLDIKDYDTIFVARSSAFREFLNIRDKQINNITILAYGTGNRPVFDATDIAPNSAFRKTANYKHIYEIAWKNEFRGNTDVSQYSVWENGWRLQRVKSKEDCENTAGSFYANSTTQPSGTDIIQVHSRKSDPIPTNKKMYEITRRSMGLDLGDNCHVYNIHTRRNGSNDGSFRAGHNAYAYGVLAEDGIKHNFMMASGTAENCMAWKCDDPATFGSTSLFIAYTNSQRADTMNLLYKNCVVVAGRKTTDKIQTGAIGLYAHTASSLYKSLKIVGGVFANTSTAIAAEIRNVLVDSTFFVNNTVAVSKGFGNMEFKNSNVILPNSSSASAIAADNRLDGVIFCENKVYMPAEHQVAVKLATGAPRSLRVSNNTVVSKADIGSTLLYYNSGGGNALLQKNLVANIGRGTLTAFYTYDNFSTTNMTADSNHYSTIPDGSNVIKVSWGDLRQPYKGLPAIRSLGFESNSTAESNVHLQSRISGIYETTNFFLPKSDSLNGRYGSASTYDSIPRYPFYLKDTLGFKLPGDSNPSLPDSIKFTLFTGVPKDTGNVLTWETVGKPVLYRLECGSTASSMVPIDSIAHGNDVHRYSFMHNPANKGKNYYRLAAITDSDSIIYSEVIMIHSLPTLLEVTAGPNPVRDELNIYLATPEVSEATVTLLSLSGQPLRQNHHSMDIGNHLIVLNTRQLNSGVYILLIKIKDKTKAIRIVKN